MSRYTWRVDQGATFSEPIRWIVDDVPVNLTGYTARFQVRRHPTAAGAPLLDLTVGSGLAIDAVNGQVTITMTPTQTATLPPGRLAYALELTDGSANVFRFIEGSLVVTPELVR